MHTRHSRKAKSAAADFVKRVISGHDTSPVPSSKPKSQVAKAKQVCISVYKVDMKKKELKK